MKLISKLNGMGEDFSCWQVNDVKTRLKLTEQITRNNHKIHKHRPHNFTAITALGISVTSVPEAKAGGTYWNNYRVNAVVFNRCYYYHFRAALHNRHHYIRWCGVLAGPKSASALGSQVVPDISVTNFEINILTNSSTPSVLIRLFIIFKQRTQW